MSHGGRAVGREEAQRGVAVDGSLVSGPSQSGIDFQFVEEVQVFDERFLSQVPSHGNRWEIAPLVVVAEFRRAVGAQRGVYGIAVVESVGGLSHEGCHRGVLIERGGAVPGA